jgi:hypothetical protein
MVTPAVAPNNTTYASRIPYITPGEWQNAPTGLDANSIVPGGQPALQASQLAATIGYASSMVDNYCYQVLAATTDTESGKFRIQRDGTVRIPCDRTPILEVDAVQMGWLPSALTALTDLSNVWIDRKVVTVPVPGSGLGTATVYPVYAPWVGSGGQVYVVLTYVNGYVNTLLTSAATAAATSVVLDSTLGVYAGTVLTISDGQNTEQVTVTTTPTTSTVAVSALAFDHPAKVSVSNLPPAVKEATILLTTALIKTRGSEAIVMGAIRETPSQKTQTEDGGLEEITLAKSLLDPFRRVR